MAYENDILTRNDDDELSVRVVQSTGDNPASSYDDVYTRDSNGKLAVRVVGGGDSHNKGYFATQAALEEAYPTAEPGDFAIVESTDTVWVWDSDTSAWKDSDTKGQVTSVNNQTGAVTLTASDVGAATAAQGAKADTAVQPGNLATVATTGAYSDLTGTPTIPAAQVNSDWNASSGVAEILNKPTLATVATSGAYSDLTGTPTIPAAIQVSTMPTAAAGELDKIYQFVGTTDANYTNGYFYKCVSDGQDPATYSWTQTDVQPQAGGLPSQSGNSGKFLTTDGTDASWSDKPLVNKGTSSGSLIIAPDGVVDASDKGIVLYSGSGQLVTEQGSVAINSSRAGLNAICISAFSATGLNAIQLGGGVSATNPDANTFKVGNANGNYEIMSADGTIPADRLPNAINKYSTMPTAASTNVGWIVQFTGTTDSTYTHGYIYECKAQGTDPETYAWEAVSVQAGGGSSLPSQTGNSGKFLTTDGTDASWSDKPLVNTFSDSTSVGILSYENRTYPRNVVIGTNIRYEATTTNLGDSVWIGDSVNHLSLTSYWQAPNSVIIGSKAAAQENSVVVGYNARGGATNYANGSVCIGYQAGTNGGSSQVAVGYASKAGYYSVAIGREASANYSSTYLGAYTIAIGSFASATAAGAIQIGKGTNSTGGTLQIGLSTGGAYGTTNQYVLLDSDGMIPEARLADTTNATAGDVLTLDSNGNAVWQAGGGGGGATATTATLATANWSSNSQTVSVTGVTANNVVYVMAAPASAAEYAAAGVQCTAQASGTLTFTCTTTPSSALTVNIAIF